MLIKRQGCSRESSSGIHEELGLLVIWGSWGPVSCFCLAGGIYSKFALKRVERISGREPTFLLGPGGVYYEPATVEESL